MGSSVLGREVRGGRGGDCRAGRSRRIGRRAAICHVAEQRSGRPGTPSRAMGRTSSDGCHGGPQIASVRSVQWPRATPRMAGAADAALAIGFSAMAMVETLLRWDDGYTYGPDLLNIPLLLLVTLPLALRRRAPRLAVAIAFGSVAVSSVLVAHTLFFFGGLLPLGLLLYSAARWVDGDAYALLLGPVLLLVTYPLHVPPFDASDYLFGGVLFGLSWAAGRLVRRLDAQRRLLADALASQQREQAARERALLLDERARIACELHDVVAHAVSVMVVQAGAARFALGADEDEVRERLLSVEQAGRAAVDDLRRLLELLRADDDEEAHGPQPGLAQLGRLVDELQRAGLPVRVEADE